MAKASLGKISFGSPGTATPSHLTGELLALATGTKLTHVPCRGDAPTIQDLLGGQIDPMMLSAIGVEPLVKSGRVKALAVSSLTRLNFMPDLPTIAESGSPRFPDQQPAGDFRARGHATRGDQQAERGGGGRAEVARSGRQDRRTGIDHRGRRAGATRKYDARGDGALGKVVKQLNLKNE
jgi:hypothetical protein